MEQNDDGTLSVYGSKPYADYTLLAWGPVEEMVRRYDVSGGCGGGSSGKPTPPHPSSPFAINEPCFLFRRSSLARHAR